MNQNFFPFSYFAYYDISLLKFFDDSFIFIRFGKNGTNFRLDDYHIEFDRLLNFSLNDQNKTIGFIGHYQVDGKLTTPARGTFKVIEIFLRCLCIDIERLYKLKIYKIHVTNYHE